MSYIAGKLHACIGASHPALKISGFEPAALEASLFLFCLVLIGTCALWCEVMVSVEHGIIYSLQTKLWSDEPSTLTVYREWREKKQQQRVFFFPCTSADFSGTFGGMPIKADQRNSAEQTGYSGTQWRWMSLHIWCRLFIYRAGKGPIVL